MGNKFYAIDYYETKIIFSIELVEGKDEPKKVVHAVPEFGEETGPKITLLCLRMTKSTWGSGRSFVLKSEF